MELTTTRYSCSKYTFTPTGYLLTVATAGCDSAATAGHSLLVPTSWMVVALVARPLKPQLLASTLPFSSFSPPESSIARPGRQTLELACFPFPLLSIGGSPLVSVFAYLPTILSLTAVTFPLFIPPGSCIPSRPGIQSQRPPHTARSISPQPGRRPSPTILPLTAPHSRPPGRP